MTPLHYHSDADLEACAEGSQRHSTDASRSVSPPPVSGGTLDLRLSCSPCPLMRGLQYLVRDGAVD